MQKRPIKETYYNATETYQRDLRQCKRDLSKRLLIMHICACVYTHMRTQYVRKSVRACACVVRVSVCVSVCVQVCVCVDVCVCVYAYVHTRMQTHTHTHTHAHTHTGAGRKAAAVGRQKFSKVLATAFLYIKCVKALGFQNFLIMSARGAHQGPMNNNRGI